MSRWIKCYAWIAAVMFILIPGSGRAGADEGAAAPDFSLKGLDGAAITLADFEGQVLFINFWATWCPPCREEIPGFIEVYETYKEDGMAILGVSLDRNGPPVVVKFAEKLKIPYPLAMGDQRMLRDYSPGQYIPSTIVVDREGRIRDKHVGYLDKGALEKLFLKYSKPPR